MASVCFASLIGSAAASSSSLSPLFSVTSLYGRRHGRGPDGAPGGQNGHRPHRQEKEKRLQPTFRRGRARSLGQMGERPTRLKVHYAQNRFFFFLLSLCFFYCCLRRFCSFPGPQESNATLGQIGPMRISAAAAATITSSTCSHHMKLVHQVEWELERR